MKWSYPTGWCLLGVGYPRLGGMQTSTPRRVCLLGVQGLSGVGMSCFLDVGYPRQGGVIISTPKKVCFLGVVVPPQLSSVMLPWRWSTTPRRYANIHANEDMLPGRCWSHRAQQCDASLALVNHAKDVISHIIKFRFDYYKSICLNIIAGFSWKVNWLCE